MPELKRKLSLLDVCLAFPIVGAIGFMLLPVPIPGLHVSLGKESYMLLVVWVILGAVFYYRRRFKNA